MKYTLILLSTIIFMACNTSKTSVDSKKVVIDEVEVIEREKAAEVNAEKNDRGYLIGIVNKESFTDDAYKSWFDSRYEEYTTDKEVIEQLKGEINNFTIKGFMGTWCGDSRREVPRFYKILEETGFNEDYFELISVGRNKRTPDNLQEGYNLIRVPTFIFLKNDKEVGRFVEYPRETIEKDILKIVQGKSYKHSYDKSED
ncbi:thioredoxin family protein [Polaribacter sp. Hel_I_88]|uniref:thioredoxin family protein n=1 Tax=Polaribacter sp. Hel_I_88 TaxID=1250006 RepID=UPI00047A47E6|nr:thioredoxin family protein [Polaribacter sp. Hel_I_88]